MQTLLASAARTASGNSGNITDLPHPEALSRASFLLDVTAAATDADDDLDVYLQTFKNGLWEDFVHFTQVVGNGGAKKFEAHWSDTPTPETEQAAPSDAAMAAGVIQGGALGIQIRVKWVIVDPSGSNASFTFIVSGEFVRRR